MQGERGQLQAGDPAFGALLQCGDVLGWKIQAHVPVEELGRLGRGEAEVGRAQLGQLSPAAQAGQRQPGIFAGGDGEVQL